jgi:hypothetical protein
MVTARICGKELSGITGPLTAWRTPSAVPQTFTSGNRIHDGGSEIWPDCSD